MDRVGNYITLVEASKIVPGSISVVSLWRWCRVGFRSKSGERVRLQYVKAGRKIFTKAVWVHEFLSKLAHVENQYFDKREKVDIGIHVGRNERQSARNVDRAREYLKQEGVI